MTKHRKRTATEEAEARKHQMEYSRWRHDPAAPQLGVCRQLPHDLGYYADEREHCPHCQDMTRRQVRDIDLERGVVTVSGPPEGLSNDGIRDNDESKRDYLPIAYKQGRKEVLRATQRFFDNLDHESISPAARRWLQQAAYDAGLWRYGKGER